jgi:hypothetical protein
VFPALTFVLLYSEVLKAVIKTRELYNNWRQTVEGEGHEYCSAEEQEWSATELRNSLRSMEWDLEVKSHSDPIS